MFAHINYCDAPVSLNARLKRFRGRDSECTPLLSKVSSGRTCCVHSRLFCNKKHFRNAFIYRCVLICKKLKQWEVDLCITCNNFCRAIKARDARRITAAEMKYLRRTAGYTWTGYKTNSHIAKELEITPVLDKLLEYKRNWIQHVNRMPRDRLPRIMKHYSPTGRRNRGRPLKRLLDT